MACLFLATRPGGVQNKRLIRQKMWPRRLPDRALNNGPILGAVAFRHDRHSEQARGSIRQGVQEDDLAPEFVPQRSKFEPVRGVGRRENSLCAKPGRVFLQFSRGAARVDGGTGVVGGDREEGDSVLGACRENDHDAIVRPEMFMEARGWKSKSRDEPT